MKFTTKCAGALVALMAVSTVGTSVSFAEAEAAKTATGTGKVTVGEAEDTVDPKDPDKDKVTDPEKPDPKDPKEEEVDTNKEKGPIKVEKVSVLNFGKINNATKAINKQAASITLGGETRGNYIQFADVRSEQYGYTIGAKLEQQFSQVDAKGEVVPNGAVLAGSEITYNNPIIKAADGNDNVLPSGLESTIKIKEDKAVTNLLTADGSKKEGKGRYVVEFGQSADYVSGPGAGLGGTAGTADKAVNLMVPTKTAANMVKSDYQAKIQWIVSVTP